jgi:xanthine dehydrogenase accessory factor
VFIRGNNIDVMFKQFFRKLDELRKSGEPFVVGTVVKVSGSTYRRPGARVLITKDGAATGLISGGCFESDLMERAKEVMQSGEPVTVTFDTTSPDDLIFGLGLGCTGVAQILLERFQGSARQQHLDFIRECTNQERPGIVGTVFRAEGELDAPIGARLMITSDGEEAEGLQNMKLTHHMLEQGRSALEQEKSTTEKIEMEEGAAEVLFEFLPLPVPLVIFGAGPDAVPLARFGSQLGWHVTVVDRRPAFARADRFPEARVMLCEPADLAANLRVHRRTYAVIMTHHHETDVDFLKQLLPSTACYIGLLGPQAKAENMIQKLREEGVAITTEQLARVHYPVGLDIGAETPEEIALAIVSEIQAIQQGYSAGFLRDRSGPIHQRKLPTP